MLDRASLFPRFNATPQELAATFLYSRHQTMSTLTFSFVD
ncbi:hypothetical protein TERTU_1874 [Teredinibacter turnerae T7901]|uniref:Uncharacterized protein n=1 Tax=Teredinibacter turnerae (strain ATCC 39867 / T7901) TaxID=377629 RepID=C5BHY4_TERTT|nr:hypothetical protein TERTU_1874 [Teredinibacter turnerae T7901]